MEISNSAYARHRGVSEAAVRKAIKQGRISQTEDGKIDLTIADQEWEQNSDPAQVKSLPIKHGTGNKDLARIGESYQKSRTLREAYNAQLAKLQFERESGKLIEVEEVKIAAYNAARITRDRLLMLPKKVAPLILGKTDLKNIEEMIKRHLIEVLDEVSHTYDSGK